MNCDKCGNSQFITFTAPVYGAIAVCSECSEVQRNAACIAEAKDAVCQEARDLLMGGYDGPCMGEEIAPLMRAVIAYDALIDSKSNK